MKDTIMSIQLRQFLKTFSKYGLITLLYFVMARAGLLFVFHPENVSAVWPASGFGLAVLLLNRQRNWPGVLLAIFIGNTLANFVGGNSIVSCFIFAFVNSAESVLAAWLLIRFLRSPISFSNTREFGVFLVVAIIFSNAITATVGALFFHFLLGSHFFNTWSVWWIADGAGMLLVTPFIVIWTRKWYETLSSLTWPLIMEIICVFVPLIALTSYFFGPMNTDFTLTPIYLLYPLFIWIALRFQPVWTTTAIFAITSILAFHLFRDHGPFSTEAEIAGSRLLAAQLFLCVTGFFTMTLSLSMFERKHADEKLRESEERYRTILKTAIDGFWLTDIQGRILDVNTAYCKMSGYSEQELLTMSISDLDHNESATDTASHIQKIKTEGMDLFDSRHRRKDGSFFDVEVSTQYRPNEGKQFVVFLRDISERRQAEKSLREAKMFLDNLSDLAYMADMQGNVTWVNPVAEKITGLPMEDIVGKSFLPLFEEQDHASLIDVYKRSLQGESLENTLTFTSGVTCDFTSLPRRDETGDIIGTFGIARDISGRLRMENALRESEARLKKAQSVARIGNWEYDVATGMVWGSEEAFRIYGIERVTEYIPLAEIKKLIVYMHNIDQALVDLITKNADYDIEYAIHPGNSEDIKHIHSVAELLCDETGEPLKVQGVIQDITDFKEKEMERQTLEGQLQQAQKMESIGRLAGGVAHDFNNMLAVILGNTELAIVSIETSNPLHGELLEIQNAAQRSADLTKQLLAFARKQTVAPIVLDLNETIDNMLNMLKRLIGEDITLSWKPSKDIGQVKIDPSQIDQILANLCVNAREAINDIGKVTIETVNVTFDEAFCTDHLGYVPGEYVMLAVSDDGIGMDEETQAQIFEPFYTTNKKKKGTGLGLSTVYGIVKQNDGFISVYSELGEGTTFKIYLPQYSGKSVSVSVDSLSNETKRGSETILLVEDEPSILKLGKTILERLGYTVLAASTPGEAIRLANENSGLIHLLITDVVMPEMNGRDLAKNLLNHYPNLKRLFMSGYTANVIAHHGVLDEGVNFIQKPFSMKDLSAKVREVLEQEL